jgi:ppGpp synthetase/RelA/SpoT-type nucleotidyltranferase
MDIADVEKQQIGVVVENMRKYIADFGETLSNKFINETIARETLFELEIGVKSFLTLIFGREKNSVKMPAAADLGLASDILKYQMTESDDYRDSAIFTYWSRTGEFDIYLSEKQGKWRENFFYKGRRWSDKNLKERFYKFFQLIEMATSGNTPVKFFTQKALAQKRQYLCIVTGETALPNPNADVLNMPTMENLREFENEALNRLLDNISIWKEANHCESREYFQQQLGMFTQETVNKLFEDAFQDFIVKHKGIVEDWRNKISSVVGEWTSQDVLKEVFMVVLSYQYYDIPYSIHCYLPSIEIETMPMSALIITTRIDNNRIANYKDILLELSNTLNEVAKLEETILKLWITNMSTYWHWKDIYNSEQGKYERLAEMAINICRAICQDKKIKYINAPYRVKDFDSFYTKVLKIANDGDDRANNFRAAIESGNKENALYIFSELKDIAGARLICLYDDDIQTIIDEFDKLLDGAQLMKVDSKWHDHTTFLAEHHTDSDDYGYRAFHLVFFLGEERLKMYEYSDLKGLKCELQIRTELSDGWAQASHELKYKSKLKISKKMMVHNEQFKIFEDKFRDLAIFLSDSDKKLIDLKELFCDIYAD